MSDIQNQIELLLVKAKQIENETSRALVGLGMTAGREIVLIQQQLTDKLRAMEALHNHFLAEAEDLRCVTLKSCERLLDLEVQIRHEALKLSPDLEELPETHVIEHDPGVILELGETAGRRKQTARG